MAVDAYIRAAASQLREAAARLHDEIRSIQVEAYDDEIRMKHEASQAEYDAATLKAEMKARQAYNMENSEQQNREVRIRELETLIGQRRKDTEKRSSDAANVVKQKNDVLSKLQELASQLESLAASARQH